MLKVKIDLDENHHETTITIHAKEWSKELELLVEKLKEQTTGKLIGTENDKSILLHPNEIDFIYAQDRKVFAAVNKRSIEINMKLYEVEELLETYHFTRFSKSVIGNLQQIDSFELSFNGNLCVFFRSGNKEYVSRKYVMNVKEKLILGGGSK